MKLLLTGSSGFIGTNLAPVLAQDFELHHLKSNLLDFTAVQSEVAQVQPDVIVHLAARTEVEQSFYEQITFSQINYVGTVNLIESAAKLKNLKNFVFASTMEVYGWQPISDQIKNGVLFTPVAFDEHTQPNPNAPYAVAKYACEKYLEYAHRSLGLPFTAIRQTNSYGRQDNNYFVITQMLTNPAEVNLGYADPYRNFIYIADLLEAWQQIIQNYDQVNTGMIFTIGPDSPVKIRDYADMIAQKLNWQGNVNWDTKPARPGEIYWLNSNHTLITNTLGWSPKISLSQGLDKTIEIWKSKYAQN